MLKRFCLYGFLKNQNYFDAFWVLAFLDRGLSFTWIGLLIGLRELCVNLLEIPTGAVADVLGRRRSMIASFLAYIGSFLLMGFFSAGQLGAGFLFPAMVLFAVGDAFRTGTHKAMIFTWLGQQGRGDEKTHIYGLTRSFSKLGSALAVPVAAGLVYFWGYPWVFWGAIPLYLISIVNFLTYPKSLDREADAPAGIGEILRTLRTTLRRSLRRGPLRRFLVESMSFEGVYKVSKDYLQPVIGALAMTGSVGFLASLAPQKRVAVLMGAVSFLLYILASIASRRAGAFARRSGGESRAARTLWILMAVSFAALTAALGFDQALFAAGVFVFLAVLQNLWRPILISRVASRARAENLATVLSVESQAKSLFAAVFAPLIGLSVDAAPRMFGWAGLEEGSLRTLLPVAFVGLLVSVLVPLMRRRRV